MGNTYKAILYFQVIYLLLIVQISEGILKAVKQAALSWSLVGVWRHWVHVAGAAAHWVGGTQIPGLLGHHLYIYPRPAHAAPVSRMIGPLPLCVREVLEKIRVQLSFCRLEEVHQHSFESLPEDKCG